MSAYLKLKPMGRRPKIQIQNPTAFGLGRSDTKSLYSSFPKFPGYSGDETDQTLVHKFFFPPELQNGQINDGGVYFGLVNRNYQDAPDLRQVRTGGAGNPGTPYSPNAASPTERWNIDSVPHSPYHNTETAINGQSSTGGGAFFGVDDTNPKTAVPKLLGNIRKLPENQ